MLDSTISLRQSGVCDADRMPTMALKTFDLATNAALHSLSRVVLAVALALIVGSILSTFFKAIYNLYFHPLRKYPGPKSWLIFPILQTIAQLRGQLDFKIRDCHERYGEIVRLQPDQLTFTSPEAWKDIYGHGHPELPKCLSKESSLGNNIIHSDASDHFRFRRAMLPAFSDKALSQQEPLIQVYVDLLVQRLKELAAGSQPTDMVRWYQFTTFDLIGDLAYGESFDGLKAQKSNPLVDSINKMMKLFPILALTSQSPILAKLLLSFASDSVKKSRQQHLNMTTALTMKRINNHSQRDRGDFMDFMMRSRGEKHGLTDAELVSNSDTLIVAGSETTATLLCGVTYYLLRTPSALAICVEEVRSAFPLSAGEIHFKSASTKLTYMLACLDEALRLFPPIPTVLSRHTTPDSITPIAGHAIPPNTVVGVHHLSTYHSERHFHDAKSFHPERWLPEIYGDPSSPFYNDRRDAFKPFSDGPRNCIGRNLAYHEMRLILAKVLWGFDLELAEVVEEGMMGWAERQRTFALWEKTPLMVRVLERGVGMSR